MKRYEALLIIHNPTNEDGIKEVLDAISANITGEGGRVETVQKMDRKSFARVPHKTITSGFFANVIFEAPGGKVPELRNKMNAHPEVFRAMVTDAPAVAAPLSEPTAEAAP